jgi:hypothetical protein
LIIDPSAADDRAESCSRQGVHRLLWQSLLALDPYIIDTLLPDLVGHDRQPSAFLVYLYLWRQTHGAGRTHAQVALIDIAESTGLSKRAVQDALGRLTARKLVTVARESITAVPVYSVLRPWRRTSG